MPPTEQTDDGIARPKLLARLKHSDRQADRWRVGNRAGVGSGRLTVDGERCWGVVLRLAGRVSSRSMGGAAPIDAGRNGHAALSADHVCLLTGHAASLRPGYEPAIFASRASISACGSHRPRTITPDRFRMFRHILQRIRVDQQQVGALSDCNGAEAIVFFKYSPTLAVPDLTISYADMPASAMRLISR